jgi:hypothetical protein
LNLGDSGAGKSDLALRLGFTALADGRYKLEERLARWLLMAQDRSEDRTVNLPMNSLPLCWALAGPA